MVRGEGSNWKRKLYSDPYKLQTFEAYEKFAVVWTERQKKLRFQLDPSTRIITKISHFYRFQIITNWSKLPLEELLGGRRADKCTG